MADTAPLKPGDDRGFAPDSPSVIKAIRAYKTEAKDARRIRILKNKENRNAYLGHQDFSGKIKGQSTEFLPKTAAAVEQFVGFAKRALTQFGAWYDVDLGRESKSPLSATSIRAIMDCFLDDILVEANVKSTFPILLTDSLKVGALESLIILKIYGNTLKERTFSAEPGQPFISEEGTLQQGQPELVSSEVDKWYLRIDLIPPEDYYPDPTGRGLYEIHSTEHDLHHIISRAEEGVYDKAAVNLLVESVEKAEEEKRREIDKGQAEGPAPSFRKKVVVDEFWGTLLNEKGRVAKRNVFAAVANDRFLIRPPEPNPFWHQESPFLAVPLIRVPFSVWHKALYDHGVQLNLATNELFNLMLDGGLSSVWGIKQLRISDLDDPSQVSGGIAQGDTLAVKSTLPHGAKVMETVSEGEVPRDAMLMFEALNREFVLAVLSNELKLGTLPPKQVKATEIIELSQSQAVTLDSIISDIERALIAKTLRKVWLVILQNMDRVPADKIISAIGTKAAFALAKMSPAERFAAFAGQCQFKVHGLSAVLSKVRDFQKIMALLQAVIQNPILLQAFFKRYSGDKILAHMMKSLNVNPEQMQRDAEELARLDKDIQELPTFQALTSNKGGGGAGLAAQDVGDASLPAEINQAANPLTGMGGAS